MITPFDQSRYQVRFEWGVPGLDALAPSDVVVVVDVLRFSTNVVARVDAGETVPLDAAAHAVSLNGAAVAARAAELDPAPTVFLGAIRNAAAVARAALAEQTRRGARTSIAVIAAGELAGREPGARLRFAVEDLLGTLDAGGMRHLLCTDIARDGMQTGIDVAAYCHVTEVAGFPVVASGGISTLDDIRALAAVGEGAIEGAITGRALYEGNFTLVQALAAARGEE